MATSKQPKLPLESRNKPVREFRNGAIRCTVWLNETANGSSWHSVQISRSYKKSAGDGSKWETTNQFNLDDLLVVSKLAELAYHFITQPKT